MFFVMRYLLLFVEVVVSLLLIGAILLQKTKSQGIGLAFGGGMGESLFGARVGNVLTKTTVVLGIIFLVNTTLLAMLETGRRTESIMDSAPRAPAATQPAVSPQPAAPEAPPPPASDFDAMAPMDSAPVVIPDPVPAAPVEPLTASPPAGETEAE